IVDKFLQDDERPLRRAMPGLRDQFFLARKVEQARRTERLSLKTRLSRRRMAGRAVPQAWPNL
ncbi:MAG TPA: hypothetical protein VM910_15015, partial [Bradyrhizobium sp.]|nr:hypothetical protein [Bradyrhizobium sp.]